MRCWLDAIKPGYGTRFGDAFNKLGVEDVADLTEIEAGLLPELGSLLETLGGKPVQIQKIFRAIEAASSVSAGEAAAPVAGEAAVSAAGEAAAPVAAANSAAAVADAVSAAGEDAVSVSATGEDVVSAERKGAVSAAGEAPAPVVRRVACGAVTSKKAKGAKTEAKEAVVAVAGIESPFQELPEGSRIRISGLRSKPELNGTFGVIAGSLTGERYPVRTCAGDKPILLRLQNIQSKPRQLKNSISPDDIKACSAAELAMLLEDYGLLSAELGSMIMLFSCMLLMNPAHARFTSGCSTDPAENAVLWLAADGLKAVLQTMRAHCTHAECCERGIVTITTLLLDHPMLHAIRASETVKDSGAVEVVAETMRRHPGAPSLQGYGCRCLLNMVQVSDNKHPDCEGVPRIIQAGGAEVLLSAMQRLSEVEMVAMSSMKAVGVIALHPDGFKAILQQGGVQKVVQMMMQVKLPSVQQTGLMALGNIAQKLFMESDTEKEAKELVFGKAGIEIALCALRNHTTDKEILSYGCAFVGNLAVGGGHKMIEAGGGVTLLEDCVQSAELHGWTQVKVVAERALFALSLGDEAPMHAARNMSKFKPNEVPCMQMEDMKSELLK